MEYAQGRIYVRVPCCRHPIASCLPISSPIQSSMPQFPRRHSSVVLWIDRSVILVFGIFLTVGSAIFVAKLFLVFRQPVCRTVRPMLWECCLSVCLSVLSVCPICNVCVLWPNGWMDQDDTWHGRRPRPWPYCVRWRPIYPSPKGHSPPIFGPCLLKPNG